MVFTSFSHSPRLFRVAVFPDFVFCGSVSWQPDIDATVSLLTHHAACHGTGCRCLARYAEFAFLDGHVQRQAESPTLFIQRSLVNNCSSVFD